MRISPRFSNILARLCTFYIPNKEKRRLKRQDFNMRFGNMSGELIRFIDMVKKKHQGLLENADSIDTLFIGDSHAEFGALSFLISNTAYNYALTANGLYEIYRTLQIATEKCPKLKKVVCFVSFYQCGYSEIRGSGAKWCQALDNLLGIEYDYSLNKVHNYELTACALTQLLSNNEEKNFGRIYCQGYNFTGIDVAPVHEKDKERAAHHFKIYANYKSEIVWLQKICDWVKKHNQELYLINSPERSDYKQVIAELSNGADVLAEIKNIAQKNNVPFYNFNDDFNDSDLADSDHLNFNGAVKMTRKIAEIIK